MKADARQWFGIKFRVNQHRIASIYIILNCAQTSLQTYILARTIVSVMHSTYDMCRCQTFVGLLSNYNNLLHTNFKETSIMLNRRLVC